MSNKNLLLSVLGVIIVFAAIFAYFRLKDNKSSELVNNQEINLEEKTMEDTKQEETKPAEVKVPESNACVRNFNAETLKTAKVDIQNRKVEIQVKEFGKIVVSFYEKDSPKTVENFLRLANSGYFDCLTFHRVSKGFVIQGGDPTGTGSGGESAFGGEFADETNPELQIYKTGYVKGTLAMANRGPNTNTSQFFIMLEDKELPPNYTIFGKVVQGMDVVSKIEAVDITPGMFGPTDGAPKTPVVMTSVKIVN